MVVDMGWDGCDFVYSTIQGDSASLRPGMDWVDLDFGFSIVCHNQPGLMR